MTTDDEFAIDEFFHGNGAAVERFVVQNLEVVVSRYGDHEWQVATDGVSIGRVVREHRGRAWFYVAYSTAEPDVEQWIADAPYTALYRVVLAV